MLTELGRCISKSDLWGMQTTPSSDVEQPARSCDCHHNTQYLAFIDRSKDKNATFPQLKVLAHLCFSPDLEVSKMALEALSIRSESDSETRPFLRTLEVPSVSTERSSKLVPFAGRLCSALVELVSEMKSLFTEPSPSDGTISALSAPLPSESPLLTGNAVVEMLCEGISLLCSLHSDMDNTFDRILIDCDFVPFLKSTIIACLDLLEQQKTAFKCVNVGISDTLIKILDSSWYCAFICLYVNSSLRPVFESTFSDVPQLCSLWERTCCHSSPTHSCHLKLIINVSATLPHLIPRLLEENLVERVIDTSKPMEVPAQHGQFHLRLIWAIGNLVRDPKDIADDKEQEKIINKMQFERVVKPAKQYLQFILQREEFIPKDDSRNEDLPAQITKLLIHTYLFERNMFEDGEIVETGREEWEVGWLVEKTDETDLGERLKKIREDDVEMKKDENARWKKRVERLREAGHEDAMEGWLTRMDNETPSELVEFIENRLFRRHVSSLVLFRAAHNHNIDVVADPVTEDEEPEAGNEHDEACWGADVVGCGEFRDRLAFGEHSELDAIAADAADNQHGAGGGWAGGVDGSGEQAGSPSKEIVKTLQANQICGKYQTLRTAMLNGLLIIAAESDWALSAILEVEYIKPLEEYCEKTQPCDVPIAFPKLLSLIAWKLCALVDFHSSIIFHIPRPSHNREFSIPHLTILTQLCFSPHLELSKMALEALTTRFESDSATRSFLQKHKVPSVLTDSSSELVPFAGRLYSTLTEHVSQLKSLFPESSPSDGIISALSTTLPSESPLLTRNTGLELHCEGFFLLYSLLFNQDSTFNDTLIGCDFVPLLKSTIIVCLDLFDRQQSEVNCPPSDRTELMINILGNTWICTTDCLFHSHTSLHPIVESTFADIPQLCSLLERTCCHTSPPHSSHLHMIINIAATLRHLIPRLLEENLVERVINASNPKAVSTTQSRFHLYVVWAIRNLIWRPKDITHHKEERKRIQQLQFERVLKPAKQYLQFILQREEFIPKAGPRGKDLSKIVSPLLKQTLLLERELFECGENVETGREEWEVGWLVEKTKETDLGERLKMIREDDVEMKKDENARWKKRVERLREAGHEDAMEGWLTRKDNETASEIVEYLRHGSSENGMNVRF
ncbi:hypothetical protein BLNAU_8096 [Blattamonas nauphoetae]|uniref:Uncharacterized protein n=1 Tax=Blattamonas nauphoetae TaxID=2049346 RepID=A0ABQ9XZW8_9EUKA|nr:hypothetical protein BLNAU_8096 [Blattamonas nauphoetae]